ncbi:hypothetical protein [Paenibacillus illinoisensis]|uniref:hypothetical protein n=1 Tax=Paenibacillus illinoisensis TaxID=59845 RepID=UPI003D968B0F
MLESASLYSSFTQSLDMGSAYEYFTGKMGKLIDNMYMQNDLGFLPAKGIEFMEHLIEWIRDHGKLVLLCTCVILACVGLWMNHKQLFYKE